MARAEYIFETNSVNGGFLVDRRTDQIVGTTSRGVDRYFVNGETNPVTGGLEFSVGGAVIKSISTSLLPLYIESMVSHGRSGYGVPSGIASYPSKLGDAGAYEVTGVTVTGGKGATTLAINSGTVADLAGTWSGVILHDDGVYRTYTIRSASGASCICSPPLEAAATAAPLTNVQDSVNGQHLTEAGAFALADVIYSASPLFCTRDKFLGQIKETDTSGWTLYNGQGAGRVTYNHAGNVHFDTAGVAQLQRRRNRALNMATNANAGVQKIFDVTGKSGYLETFVSCTDLTYPAIVDVYIDGYLAFREFVTSIRRVLIPFAGALTLELRITGAGVQTGSTYIGTTTCWLTSRLVQPFIFRPGDRIGWGGDSWTSRCASAVIRRLNALGNKNGQTFVGIGKPGEQATWLISNFDKVTSANVDALIIEFFVNDANSLLEAGLATWVSRIETLVSMCQGAGIRPIVLMPASTASLSQTQTLANWAAQLAEGSLQA